MTRRILSLSLALFLPLGAAPLENGDRVVLLGDAFFEIERHTGALEWEMHRHFPNIDFSLRNLSWSGDTPGGFSRASFDPAEAGLQRLREHLELARPTRVLLAYGMAASLQELTDTSNDWTLNPDPDRYGVMTVERFAREMQSLLDLIREVSGPKVQIVLVPPIPHEDLRALRADLPDPARHNALLQSYTAALQGLATAQKADWVDSEAIVNQIRSNLGDEPLIKNGIHLTKPAYAAFAAKLGSAFGWKTPASDPPAALRGAIAAKSDAFFHRYRPANATYLFGFRKHEQGQNAKEMAAWDEVLVAADARIAAIKRGATPAPFPPLDPPSTHPDPELVAPDFTVPDGYRIDLWAEAPLVRKPLAMNWDGAGQLWVASTPIYPQIAPGKSSEDKIYVLADRDGDGKAETSTIFADDLLIPTGLAPVPTGKGEAARACYVGASTEVLLLSDSDGDGKADQRQVILAGFGTEDTHHNIHTLRWGPDGRLHMNQSIYTHSHMETPWGVVRLNAGGVLAYDPASERVEVFSRGFWNSWGHVWDKHGQSFLSDGAGFNGLAWVFPGAILNPSEGAQRQIPTISPGRYPKYAGLELIDSPHFSADWQGTAVTCDFRAHRIVRFAIQDLENREPKRSGYVTQELEPLVVTGDVAFRPIDVKHGPDGALYFADWTNPIINHGEVDFRDPRRDQSNGRIWRLSRIDAPAMKWTPTEIPVARSTDPEKDGASDSPRRRIEAMRTLARSPSPDTAARILEIALQGPPDDPFYEFAAWRSIRDVGPAWVAAVKQGEWTLGERSLDPSRLAQASLALRSLSAPLAAEALTLLIARSNPTLEHPQPWIDWIGEVGDSAAVQLLLDSTDGKPSPTALQGLLTAAQRGVLPPNLASVDATFFSPATPEGLRLIGAWKLDLVDVLAAQLPASNELRNAAFEALAALRTERAIAVLTAQLKSTDPNLRRHGLTTLAGARPDLAIEALPAIAAEAGADPGFWQALFVHAGFLDQFTKAIPGDLEPDAYRAALQAARQKGQEGAALVGKLESLAGMQPANTPPNAGKSVASIVESVKMGGDAAQGELIYRRPELTCTLCHAIGGVGGKLGPDMTSIGASAPLDYLVESTLFPERNVKEGYHAMTYTLKDGNAVVGIPSRSTQTEQFVRTIAGEEAILKSAVQSQEMVPGGGSLMPAGLIDNLDWKETQALFSFLQQLGRPGPYDGSNGGVARLWTIHLNNNSLPPNDPAPDGTPLTSLVDGRVTPEILKPSMADQPAIYAKSRFVTTTDGDVQLHLEGIREAWVDGNPLPVASEPGRKLTLKAGEHLLTIKLQASELPPHFRATSAEARFLTGDE